MIAIIVTSYSLENFYKTHK